MVWGVGPRFTLNPKHRNPEPETLYPELEEAMLDDHFQKRASAVQLLVQVCILETVHLFV